MYVLYILNALEAWQLERLLSRVCATEPRHVRHVRASGELTEQTVTYDTQRLGDGTGEAGRERVEFSLEVQVFGFRQPGQSALDFAWRVHQEARCAVSLSAQSIWIDEYLLLQENECYLAHDVAEVELGLAFDPSDLIPLDKDKLFTFWADKERDGPEGGYIIREYEWWRTI
jgi:hypothetical protein